MSRFTGELAHYPPRTADRRYLARASGERITTTAEPAVGDTAVPRGPARRSAPVVRPRRNRIRVAESYRNGVARYVIDAPTLLHLVAESVDVSSAHQLVAPNLIRSQALSLLLAAVRDGEITEEVALQRHERLTEIKMRLLGDRVSRRTAWKIAREHGWDTTFDAEYLAVCQLQADALITIDEALAAKAAHIVPLATLAALVAD